MNDLELKELQRLLLKLEETKPELKVLITNISDEREEELTHKDKNFFCNLIFQIDMCLDDEENDVLR